jgi:hypothetical protein
MQVAAVKLCKVCGRAFPLAHYRPTVKGLMWPDGRSNWCEECIGTSEAMRLAGVWCSISELKTRVRAAVLGLRY